MINNVRISIIVAQLRHLEHTCEWVKHRVTVGNVRFGNYAMLKNSYPVTANESVNIVIFNISLFELRNEHTHYIIRVDRANS